MPEINTPPPFNRDAEEALVGSCLVNPDVRGLIEDVQPEDFFIRRCGVVWRVAGEMVGAGEHVDILTLSDRLAREKLLDDIGGPAWLTDVITRVPSSLGAEAYASIVRNDSQRRVALQVASSIAKAALDSETPPVALWQQAADLIGRATNRQAVDGPELWTGEELATLQIPEVPWLLRGHIPEAGLVLLDGDTAAGKSWLAEDIAIAAATAGTALGRRFEKSVPVLYLGGDSRWITLVSRFRRLCTGRDVEPPRRFFLTDDAFNMAEPIGIATLRALVRRTEAKLVVIDVFGTYLVGIDENASGEVGPVLTGLRKLANDTGAAVLVLHHSTKAPSATWQARIRGSSAIAAAFDAVMLLETDAGLRTVRQVKNRDQELEPPASFRIADTDQGGIMLTWGEAPLPATGDGQQDLDARVLEILGEEGDITGSEVARRAGRQKQAVFECLRRLEAFGAVGVREGGNRSKLYCLRERPVPGGGSPLSRGTTGTTVVPEPPGTTRNHRAETQQEQAFPQEEGA